MRVVGMSRTWSAGAIPTILIPGSADRKGGEMPLAQVYLDIRTFMIGVCPASCGIALERSREMTWK